MTTSTARMLLLAAQDQVNKCSSALGWVTFWFRIVQGLPSSSVGETCLQLWAAIRKYIFPFILWAGLQYPRQEALFLPFLSTRSSQGIIDGTSYYLCRS